MTEEKGKSEEPISWLFMAGLTTAIVMVIRPVWLIADWLLTGSWHRFSLCHIGISRHRIDILGEEAELFERCFPDTGAIGVNKLIFWFFTTDIFWSALIILLLFIPVLGAIKNTLKYALNKSSR